MVHLSMARRLAENGAWDEAESLYAELAAAGDPRGWMAIGRHYCDDPHVDLTRALDCFERAAAMGSGDGALQAAHFAWRGTAEQKDPAKALRYFEQAADDGQGSIAATRAGWMRYQGEAGEVDAKGAIERFRQAIAIDEEPEAMLGLGYAYSEGKTERDPCEATHWFRRGTYESEALRDRASSEARREMFSRWAKEGVAGVHRLKDEVRALAEAGDPSAAYQISETIAGGFLGEVDGAAVLRWLERAADAGEPRACLRLAHRSRSGDGVEVDAARARALYSAAAAGDVGHHDYAYALLSGLGGPPDRDLAIEHYRHSSEQGLPRSMKDLAILLEQRGRPGDAEECTRWLRESAQRGDVDAMFRLAERHRDGLGATVDLVEATRWFLVPLRYGNGDGIHEIHQYIRRMTAEEVHEADRRADHDGSYAASLIATFLAP